MKVVKVETNALLRDNSKVKAAEEAAAGLQMRPKGLLTCTPKVSGSVPKWEM